MWTSLDDLKLGQNRSVRSRGVVSVQGQSDFACPNKKSACPYSRSRKGPRVPWRPSPWSRWKTAEGREKFFKNILGCFKICWGPRTSRCVDFITQTTRTPEGKFRPFLSMIFWQSLRSPMPLSNFRNSAGLKKIDSKWKEKVEAGL